MHSPSDKELAQRHFGGDKHALERLIDKYSGFIRYWCQQVFQDQDVVEDLTQASILRIITRIHQFDPNRKDANFKGWVATTTFRVALNYKRRIFHECKIKNVLQKENITIVENHDLSKSLHDKETEKTLHAAIDILPEPARTCVSEFHLQGFVIGDICKAHDMEKWQVKYQLSKGRRLLYKALKRIGI